MTPQKGQAGRLRPIRITEVGPRDGLQNERRFLPTKSKVAFIDALASAGVDEIEAGAFVSPKAIPQMSDSDEVFRQIARAKGVVYSALVPNERGVERALAAGAQKLAVFTAASETFTRRNIDATIAESLRRFEPAVTRARAAQVPVRGYISTVAFCPYEGRIRPDQVVEVLRRLLDVGVVEIALGETIGRAAPPDIRRLLDATLGYVPPNRLALHLHDTYGLGVANALVAWHEYGLTSFDASAGGLGGCPYAPGAAGNVATEDLVYALKASGAVVNVDETKVVEAARNVAQEIGRPLPSRLSHVLSQAGLSCGTSPQFGPRSGPRSE